ncbi:MAG: WD40 repeat domain-containing protein [Bacteroidota bacterium]
MEKNHNSHDRKSLPIEVLLDVADGVMSQQEQIFIDQYLEDNPDDLLVIEGAKLFYSTENASRDELDQFLESKGSDINFLQNYDVQKEKIVEEDSLDFTSRIKIQTRFQFFLKERLIPTLGLAASLFFVFTFFSQQKSRLKYEEVSESLKVLGHISDVSKVSFSHDGKSILTGSKDKTARLWDLDGNGLAVYEGHKGTISSVALSSDGKYVLTGSADNSVRLWDIDSSNPENSIEYINYKSNIISTAFLPDRERILSVSEDGTIRIDSIPKLYLLVSKYLSKPKKFKYEIESLSIEKEDLIERISKVIQNRYKLEQRENLISKLKLSINKLKENKIKLDSLYKSLLDVETRNSCLFEKYDGFLKAAKLSPDGKLVLGASGNKIILWSTTSGQKIKEINYKVEIRTFAFSPNGKKIVTGSNDNILRLLSLDGKVTEKFEGHSGSIYSVAISPNGKYILSGSSDNTARLWSIDTRKELTRFVGHTASILDVKFSPDGKYVLTGSADNTARLWSISTSNELKTFKGHKGSVGTVSFSPDGQMIITGSSDNTSKVWSISTGKVIIELKGRTRGAIIQDSLQKKDITLAEASYRSLSKGNIFIPPPV